MIYSFTILGIFREEFYSRSSPYLLSMVSELPAKLNVCGRDSFLFEGNVNDFQKSSISTLWD